MNSAKLHLTLENPSQAIKQLADFELPEFAVLIGRNGVGKTQLLKAIFSGNVKVSGLSRSVIKEYDINSFQPSQTEAGTINDSNKFLDLIDSFFLARSGQSLSEKSQQIFQETVDHFDLNNSPDEYREFEDAVRRRISQISDYDDAFGTMTGSGPVPTYINNIESIIGRLRSDINIHSYQINGAVLLLRAMRQSGKLLHDLSWHDLLNVTYFAGEVIENQVSQLFARYKIEQHVWAHTESENSEKSVQQLMDEYREKNCPPWDTLRARLDRMREASNDPELFNFEFSNPDKEKLSYTNCKFYSFKSRFTNKSTEDSYSVTDLSSGEKILLCLCLSAFNKDMGQDQPGLLLLDELDSVLHPSMINSLIAGLKDQFVSNGTRVIMATHSVTTVSLLDEGEVFRVSRTGNVLDVQPVGIADAVVELSEGLATIEEGLTIATSESVAPITILTEGKNCLHLKKWASLFFGDKVKVFDRLTNHTGKNQLNSYGRLLAAMKVNSHYLIVWDCDAREEAEQLQKELTDSNNVTAFAFKRRKQNRIAHKGIENNYDEKYLSEYVTESTRKVTGERFTSMNGKDKDDFAKHVSSEGTKDYFNHFDDLNKIVQEILNQ